MQQATKIEALNDTIVFNDIDIERKGNLYVMKRVLQDDVIVLNVFTLRLYQCTVALTTDPGFANIDAIFTWFSNAINSGTVNSVFGRDGDVVAVAGDYAASLITNDSGVVGATVANALDTLAGAIPSTSDHIANASAVVGATVTAALNTLAAAIPTTSDHISNASGVAGATVTAALNALNGAIGAPSIVYYVDPSVAAGGSGLPGDPIDDLANVPSPGVAGHATIYLSGPTSGSAGTLADASAGVEYTLMGNGAPNMSFINNVTGVGSTIHTHGLNVIQSFYGDQTLLIDGGELRVTSWDPDMKVQLQTGAVLNNIAGAPLTIDLTGANSELIVRQSALRSITQPLIIDLDNQTGTLQIIESSVLNSAAMFTIINGGSGAGTVQIASLTVTGDFTILDQLGNGVLTFDTLDVDGEIILNNTDADLNLVSSIVALNGIDFSATLVLPTYTLHGTQLDPGTITEAQSGGLIGPPTTDIIQQFELDRDNTNNLNSGSTSIKISYSFVNSGGSLYVDAEADGGGNVIVMLNGTRYVLDALTGSGAGGKLRSANGIAFSAGATIAKTVYMYLEETSFGNAQLSLSETSPSVAGIAEFAWAGVTIIRDTVTFGTNGVDIFQRYNDAIFHGGRGMISYEREKIRQLGATWKTGAALTPTINNTPSRGTVSIGVDAGTMYQLHLQTFSAITSPADMFVLNHPTTPYLPITSLGEITVDATNSSILGNGARWRATLVLFISSQGVSPRIGVLLPIGSYNNNSDALLDLAGYDVTTLPSEVVAAQGTAILLGTIVLRYSTAAGGDYFNVVDEETATVNGYVDRRGQALAATGSGAGIASSATTFSDANFRVFGSVDSSKKVAFEVDNITTLTTRTITIPDEDVNVGYLQQGIQVYDDGLTTDDIQAITVGSINIALRDDGAGNGVARITATDVIQAVKGGVAPYTYFIRKNGGAFGAGSTDPRSEFIALTIADVGALSVEIEVTDNGALSSGIIISITANVSNPDTLT